ncbi:MAG: 50S ribosomal protein L32 [Gemmatimonadetes bacterium]|jgi:large subunit ribosomal protein L32|nr:50S ribosomal protein L32 [Gemmatimonadota bacterium]MCY3713029.1 50S ribosomal protein L32 [Gemmatimonadota bacterium]MXZ76213.1 50S ribosomal protein L32 [Gemmatimonadota bacterium]MYA78735.1 50S ribosomal protein L32 [Gemmatimonadota bacterium]MYG16339.1 50S ribosomal protein L32 [Gemmatimonadota bacterium]
MALPKRRQSRARSRKRRTHWVLPMPMLVECSNCGEMKRAHRVCPHCGYYQGKEVLEVEAI